MTARNSIHVTNSSSNRHLLPSYQAALRRMGLPPDPKEVVVSPLERSQSMVCTAEEREQRMVSDLFTKSRAERAEERRAFAASPTPKDEKNLNCYVQGSLAPRELPAIRESSRRMAESSENIATTFSWGLAGLGLSLLVPV